MGDRISAPTPPRYVVSVRLPLVTRALGTGRDPSRIARLFWVLLFTKFCCVLCTLNRDPFAVEFFNAFVLV